MRVVLPDGTIFSFAPEQVREVDVFPVLPLEQEVVRYQGDVYRWVGVGWERLTDDEPDAKITA